ncbi:MAG: hypothetical protein ACXIVD_05510 [Salinarimonas sp.]
MLAMKPLDVASAPKAEPGPGAAETAFSLPDKLAAPVSAPSAPDGAAPALVGNTSFEFKNVDSMEGPLDPSASQRSRYCDNLFNEIMAKLEQIENIMPPPDTESMRQLIETPGHRLAMLREFDDLMELIDELFNNCRDFLPAEAIADIRDVRIDAERMRRALLIEDNDPNPYATFAARLGTTVENAARVFAGVVERAAQVISGVAAVFGAVLQFLFGDPANQTN